jgi:hypothetical protein
MVGRSHFPLEAGKPVAASVPGGAARQFRVQYQPPSEADWRLYANFSRSDQAEECLSTLRQRGIPARLVKYQCCAAAT